MAVYDEEKLYNELMNGAPSAEQSTATLNSAAALKSGEGYAAPGEYTGGIADQKLDEAINKYLNSRGFNYNTADDPDYQAYVREYKENAKQGRELSRATANTLANGYNPTYADTVSDEVYNSYMENIYSTQAQKDYGRYRDTVGDKKNFLNYLYDRYATDRQSDVQQNADKASIYGTRLSSAQSNLENARSVDNQRYLYNTQSADNRAQLAQQERENQQKIEYMKAEDAYNAKVKQAKEEQKIQDEENKRRYERNGTKYIEAYNLKGADYDYVTSQLAIGYYKGYISLGEMNYIAEELNVNSEDIEEKLNIYEKNGGSFERGYHGGRNN